MFSSFCVYLLDMSENIEKKCIKCGNIQKYSDKYHFKRAINTNALCQRCSRNLPSKKRQNLVGNLYGHLTVVELVEQRDGCQYWKCKCDCGNETVVRHSHLTCHTIRSCGCVHLYLQEKHPHWVGIGKISGSYLNQLKRSAKKRRLEITITKQELWDKFLKQDQKCALTGVDLKFDSCVRKRDGNASLDRIDSSKGYYTDNVQWVHKIVNVMKQDLDEKEFFGWCKLICERNEI